MKITSETIRKIIKEEIENLLKNDNDFVTTSKVKTSSTKN